MMTITLDVAPGYVPQAQLMESAGNPTHSSALPDRRWYCVALLSNLERMARFGLGELGLESWFPRIATRLPGFAYQDPFGWKLQPLFPGYGFVRFDKLADPWPLINDVNGVYRLFRHGPEKPTPLPRGVIEALKGTADSAGVIYPPEPRTISENDPVRVMNGPLAGFEGICFSKKGDRVRLLLTLLGRSTQVEFALADVEAVGK